MMDQVPCCRRRGAKAERSGGRSDWDLGAEDFVPRTRSDRVGAINQ